MAKASAKNGKQLAPAVAIDPFEAKRSEQRARIAQEEANLRNETLKAIDKGYTLDGVRLSHPNDASGGHVVNFREGEGAAVTAAVRKVLQARVKAK